MYQESGGIFIESTNFSSLRSYTSGIDYTFAGNGTGVNLDPFFTGEGPSGLAPPGQGWFTSWDVTPEGLIINQDVLISGSTFADSAIYHTVVLENYGPDPILVGWRNLYDWAVDEASFDDGPNNAVETTSGVVVPATTIPFSHVPASDEFVRVSADPQVPTYQPLLGIGFDPGFIPGLPATIPEEYAYVRWSPAFSTAFDYAPGVVDATNDSAGLSWFGRTQVTAIEILPGESVRLTQVVFGVIPDEPPPGEDFSKMLTDGPDVDGDGEFDLVIPVKPSTSTTYQWKITWRQPGSPPVLIADTAPAESVVDAINLDGNGLPIGCGDAAVFNDPSGHTDVYRGGKSGKNCHSATEIEWSPASDNEMLLVDVSMRVSPGRGHKAPVFAPTSCGALDLNRGAAAFEIDPATGEPATDPATGEILPPVLVSNALCIAAVRDVNGDGILDRDGSGDEDADSLSDYEEACGLGTDPCLADSDGDGVRDDVDVCPLEGPADPSLGEILDPNGCIRQSQCSDSLDNDNDGVIDFVGGDLSCDDILDDSEDTIDLSSGTILGWPETGFVFHFDDHVGVVSDIQGWWSINSLNPDRGWFYGYNVTTEVAHVTGVADICDITDASIYSYAAWSVGPVYESDFVLFHNLITDYYAAFRIDDIYGPSALESYLDATWYLQEGGGVDFCP